MSTVIIFILLTLVVVLAALLVVVPLLVQQATDLVQSAPEVFGQLRNFLTRALPEPDGGRLALAQLAGPSARRSSRVAESFCRVLTSAAGVVNILVFLVVVPVVAFYLLLDWDRMVARIDELLPRDHAPVIRELARQIDRTLASFVRGQGTVCLILGTFYAVALMVIGLQFGLVVGLVAGLLTFIPYVGALVGGPCPSAWRCSSSGGNGGRSSPSRWCSRRAAGRGQHPDAETGGQFGGAAPRLADLRAVGLRRAVRLRRAARRRAGGRGHRGSGALRARPLPRGASLPGARGAPGYGRPQGRTRRPDGGATGSSIFPSARRWGATISSSPAATPRRSQVDGWRDWPFGKLVLVGPEGAGQDASRPCLGGAKRGAGHRGRRAERGAMWHRTRRAMAVEDVDRMAGDRAAETCLFHLHNALAQRGAPMC
jgi:hypothetical protein